MTNSTNAAIDLSHRPTHVSHPTITSLCEAMREAGRTELVHYAGACYRDPVALEMCRAWLAAPTASEAVLKDAALKAASRSGW